jgi:predicted HicB family RNase H-like nuclease
MKETNYTNVRVDKTTHHQLKMLAAIRQESMLVTLKKLIEQALHQALENQKRSQ